MKIFSVILILCLLAGFGFSQKTMLVEKIGTGRKYYYHPGAHLKLRVSKQDTLLIGKLLEIDDSVISVEALRPFDVRIRDIGSVYKQFYFPTKFGRYLALGGAGIFAIIGFDHLINHEQVFTRDMFIISGTMLAGSAITLSFGQKRCRMGVRWKIKVLDIPVN